MGLKIRPRPSVCFGKLRAFAASELRQIFPFSHAWLVAQATAGVNDHLPLRKREGRPDSRFREITVRVARLTESIIGATAYICPKYRIEIGCRQLPAE